MKQMISRGLCVIPEFRDISESDVRSIKYQVPSLKSSYFYKRAALHTGPDGVKIVQNLFLAEN